MKYEGIVTAAKCKHVNGEETSKQYIFSVLGRIDDPDISPKDRWTNLTFDVPAPITERIGYHDELISKIIKIEICDNNKENANKVLDELTALSQELGLYD